MYSRAILLREGKAQPLKTYNLKDQNILYERFSRTLPKCGTYL
jgi:hypothetical protein